MSRRKITKQQTRRIQAKQTACSDKPSLINQEGLIIASYGKSLLIETKEKLHYRCYCRQHLPFPVAGDEVIWCEESPQQGVVIAVKPRRNVITRVRPHHPVKPLAANITQLLIMVAPHPLPTPLVIDSYLVTAQALNIQPLILFNKMEEANPEWEKLLALYRELQYLTLTISVHQNQYLEQVTDYLQDHTSILVGQSGVGKSSLIKALLPDEQIAIAPTLSHIAQGTHTTVKAMLYHLPPRGKLIDSPGVREFQLGSLTLAQLKSGFPEITRLASQCRFRNCQHLQETACTVQIALNNGTLPLSRWQSYHHLKKTLAVK